MRLHRFHVAASPCAILISGAVILGVACSHGRSGATSPGGLAQLEQDTGVQWAAVPDPRFGNTFHLFPRSTPPATLVPGADPSAVAMGFLTKYGG